MAVFWFIFFGVLAAWLLPGVIAAAWCLVSHDLRQRAVQLHQFSVDQAVVGYLQAEERRKRRGTSESTIRFWQDAREQRCLQLVLIAVVLTLSGPRAVSRVRSLRRSRTEIRLE